jgi:hypothetical protein
LTVSNGILSAKRLLDDDDKEFLQTTAPISHGSSGGPLLNMRGRVIGITSMFITEGENLNFAIPVNAVKELLLQESVLLARLPNEPDPDVKVGKKTPSLPPPPPSAMALAQKEMDYMHENGIHLSDINSADTEMSFFWGNNWAGKKCAVKGSNRVMRKYFFFWLSDVYRLKVDGHDLGIYTHGNIVDAEYQSNGSLLRKAMSIGTLTFDSQESAKAFAPVLWDAVQACGGGGPRIGDFN